MALLKVSPTRIELLNLKKRLASAKRGHRLLKDKRDGLMKEFMTTIRDARLLRERVSERLDIAFRHYVRGQITMPRRVAESALMVPNAKVSITMELKNVMSVAVPELRAHKSGSLLSYGFLETSGELDKAIIHLDQTLLDLLQLAGLEKRAELLAYEIEKTRRRVSALEHVMIPNLEETIKFIGMRLEEQARDAVVATMCVKAMIEARESI